MTTHTAFVSQMHSNFIADIRSRHRRGRATAKPAKSPTNRPKTTTETTMTSIDVLNEKREAAHAALMNRITQGRPNAPAAKLVRSRAIISLELATASEVDRYRLVRHIERMKMVILDDKTDQHSQRLTVGSKWTDQQFASQLSELVEIASQLGISAAVCPVLGPKRN
ncbi:hypothetical protein [Neorhodopirellula pilleata]|uniref:Uncharacterized protein n=1 Tax=Neorhodopirellula pilleata TaxID=2714738 RepID=A0A5C5ZPA3_9BACT|nr:hypothetical protein [Neorhodopirellula pilleata]TWT89314.1 hypothetical protein Pla100_56310 [Neorhodopirellula pilleata]